LGEGRAAGPGEAEEEWEAGGGDEAGVKGEAMEVNVDILVEIVFVLFLKFQDLILRNKDR
jgi:hypothetical protein